MKLSNLLAVIEYILFSLIILILSISFLVFLNIFNAYADTITVRIIGSTQCSDGIDNDADGEIDFGIDDGCESTSDNDETDPVPETSGGGSSSGGNTDRPDEASVVFKGKAYPGSSVTLLKDGQFVAKTVTGPDANFDIRISDLSSGNYTFGIWAEDKNKVKSTTQTFTINVTKNVSTSVSGIFLPPTISVDKSEVRRGDILTVLGQTFPESSVTVVFNSETELIKNTESDSDGLWLYNLDSLELEFGDHSTKSRTTKVNEISSFSKILNFKVGTKNVLATIDSSCPDKGDFNNDCGVNLVDFSMLAYWYKRSGMPSDFDLNNDHKVDLIDFSISAFYWTG